MFYLIVIPLIIVAIANGGNRKPSESEVKHSDMVLCESSSNGDDDKYTKCLHRLGHKDNAPVVKVTESSGGLD